MLARPPRPSIPALVVPLVGAVLCVGALLAAPPAAAATREQAIAQALAQARGDGRVLTVRREAGTDGRDVWAVKVIVDGRVRVHRVPAD